MKYRWTSTNLSWAFTFVGVNKSLSVQLSPVNTHTRTHACAHKPLEAVLAGRLCCTSVIWLKPTGATSGASVDRRRRLTRGRRDMSTEPGVGGDGGGTRQPSRAWLRYVELDGDSCVSWPEACKVVSLWLITERHRMHLLSLSFTFCLWNKLTGFTSMRKHCRKALKKKHFFLLFYSFAQRPDGDNIIWAVSRASVGLLPALCSISEIWSRIMQFRQLPACLPVCPPVCPPVCLPVCLSPLPPRPQAKGRRDADKLISSNAVNVNTGRRELDDPARRWMTWRPVVDAPLCFSPPLMHQCSGKVITSYFCSHISTSSVCQHVRCLLQTSTDVMLREAANWTCVELKTVTLPDKEPFIKDLQVVNNVLISYW